MRAGRGARHRSSSSAIACSLSPRSSRSRSIGCSPTSERHLASTGVWWRRRGRRPCTDLLERRQQVGQPAVDRRFAWARGVMAIPGERREGRIDAALEVQRDAVGQADAVGRRAHHLGSGGKLPRVGVEVDATRS